MPRPTKNSKNTKTGSSPRTAWKKPDGTALRKRRGDYFPDQEIDKRSAPKKRFGSDDRKPAFGSRGRDDQKPFTRRDDSGTEDKSSWERKPASGSRDRDSKKPYSRRDDSGSEGRSSWERKPASGSRERDGKKPYARREASGNDRKSSWERKPAFGSRDRDDKKPFTRRDDSRSEGRSAWERSDSKPTRSKERSDWDDSDDKPARGGYEQRAGRDRDENPSRRTSDRPYTRQDDSRRDDTNKEGKSSWDSSSPRSKRTGDKPSWKKRERYDRIEHSSNMGNRFEKGSRFKKRDDGRKRETAAPKKQFQPDAAGAIRLNRFIANAGICSRREADELIEAGVISINGEVVTELGTKVMPSDEVRFHDRVLRTERMVYVLLNKPKDFITTTDDPENRKTVMNLVHDACKERIFPVGRLDRNTTGLLLLTNDGDLTKKLTHPSSNIKKIYQVELDKNITHADMVRSTEGVELEDGPAHFDEIEYLANEGKNVLGVELHSGRNRVVRRIFEALGYEVKKLDRTVFAGLTKKDLPRGRWRMLTELEINSLKMMKSGSGRSIKNRD